ncbi:hypothetical protein [Bythopirellula goksoeyrii]|uniref:PEP-CTERM protein-sorting domain-containing protein n=1 Tax=Bythopirellula goksoeyrii TaxID=1400387 RepID=A0A5B9QSB5_9BACT|nr:hypothetical protein [Bythopirellula goksoeyrii]QEG37021.1 hypothetical protein Pr1d_43610 [Bythopirellula goksoeyrii]
MMCRFVFVLFASSLLASETLGAVSKIVFSESFSDYASLSTQWDLVADSPDTNLDVVDYRFVIAPTAFGIPEAPSSDLLSGPAQTGAYFQANLRSGMASAVGLLSKDAFDLVSFELQFDVFLSTGGEALAQNNATETVVWGVGRSTTEALSYAKRNTLGDGVWGWLATDNGFLQEDVALYQDSTVLSDLGETFDPEAPELFNTAFTPDPGIPNSAPLNDWITVKLVYDGTKMDVLFNDVLFFSEPIVGEITGPLYVGYADPFSSVSGSRSFQWGVIDNVILRDTSIIPEPTTLSLALLGLFAFGRRSLGERPRIAC